MQMLHPMRPIPVSKTGNVFPGRTPQLISRETARCTLWYRPTIVPWGSISSALL